MELIMIKPIGLCYSASSILDEIEKYQEKYSKIYILGDILHNEYVINFLSARGIKFVKSIDSIHNDKFTLVVLPSHGTSPFIYDKLKKYNYIDLTCPKIKKMHDFIVTNKDNDIIFLGQLNHSETNATKDYKNVTVITNSKDIDKLDELNNPILMCQTTYNKDEFMKVSSLLKEKYPNIVINNTLCNIPLDRIININSTDCDLLIVIGSKTSSNANEIAKSKPNSLIIGKVEEIDLDELKKYSKIAIASASSTPIQQVNEIVSYIQKNVIDDINKFEDSSFEELEKMLKKSK